MNGLLKDNSKILGGDPMLKTKSKLGGLGELKPRVK